MNSPFKIQHINSFAKAALIWERLAADGSFESDPAYFVTQLVYSHNDENLACVSLYNNPYIQKDGKKTLVFGNLHFSPDPEISSAIISSAVNYAKENGYEYLLGPINGNTWNSYRLPLDNFGIRFLTDLGHPEFYAASLADAGFSIVEKYYSSRSEVFPGVEDSGLVKQLQDQAIQIRSIRMNEYESELEKIFHFSQTVFSRNLYFSPISKEAFISKYLALRRFIDPELVMLAENREGELKAIYFVFPDVVVPGRLIIKTIARAPGDEIKGIMTVLSQRIYNMACKKGYKEMVHAFFHYDNRSRLLSERFNGKPFKSYGLFEKHLNE